MLIRRATEQDLAGLNRLLYQVLEVHHQGRPDLFREKVKKYTDQELLTLLHDKNRPIFVAVDEQNELLGYGFCILQQLHNHIMTDVKTLHIDDLCVDENCRGQHIGSALLAYIRQFAKDSGCYNLTLNVWAFNEPAKAFYEHCGLVPQKINMETIL